MLHAQEGGDGWGNVVEETKTVDNGDIEASVDAGAAKIAQSTSTGQGIVWGKSKKAAEEQAGGAKSAGGAKDGVQRSPRPSLENADASEKTTVFVAPSRRFLSLNKRRWLARHIS